MHIKIPDPDDKNMHLADPDEHKHLSYLDELSKHLSDLDLSTHLPEPEMSTPTLFFLLTPGTCLQH